MRNIFILRTKPHMSTRFSGNTYFIAKSYMYTIK